MNNYQAYLIRIWRPDTEGVWRALAQDPHQDKRYYFDSLEALLAFLAEQAEEQAPSPT